MLAEHEHGQFRLLGAQQCGGSQPFVSLSGRHPDVGDEQIGPVPRVVLSTDS